VHADKSAKLWAAITQDHTAAPWPSLIQEAELFVEQMNLTFDAIGTHVRLHHPARASLAQH
jgi:hypothetical protein